MQAQQLGKKRGAKAVMPDAGGKRAAKREGEGEGGLEPKRPCARRDVASFRAQIQQWRRTSRASDFTSATVDEIVKHFEEVVHSLEGASRNVRFGTFINLGPTWPARCPREAATRVQHNPDRTTDYRFDYTNVHSGERFSLRLLGAQSARRCLTSPDRFYVDRLQLTFETA